MAAQAKILVLGAGGRVGMRLRAAWEAAVPEDVCWAFQSRRPGSGIDLVTPTPLSEPEALAQIFQDVSPDLVLCLWGAVVLPGSAPDFHENERLACLAYRAAHLARVPRFAAMSTGMVYGTRSGPAFQEDDPLDGQTPYALSKIAMERAVSELAGNGGAPAPVMLRLANLVGADMLAWAARRASASDPLRLDRFADGASPVRGYASTALLVHLATMIATAPPSDLPFCLNVADDDVGHPMHELLKAVNGCGFAVPWLWQDAPEGALPKHCISTNRLFERFPALKNVACTSAPELAADWCRYEAAER